MKNPADQRGYRLSAIDMVRGLVVVIMALDHVRDFFMAAAEQDPMANPNITVGLFATRWVTHFCAPVFVLLAGTSAGLMAARRSPAELTRFLFTRGVWLIFVEMFVISTSATFARTSRREGGGLRRTARASWIPRLDRLRNSPTTRRPPASRSGAERTGRFLGALLGTQGHPSLEI